MKQISLLFFALLSNYIIAQDRNTLWLGGIGATSSRWEKAIKAAEDGGYQFNEVNTFNYAPQNNGVAGSATQMNAEMEANNVNNVLGIGHDGGGIILRQMAKAPNNKLSALILDGVPNQGSKVLQKMLPISGQNDMQLLVDRVLAFKSNANDCNACRIVEAFQKWVNDVNVHQQKYQEYLPSSPIISNLGTPNIPYAVIWGNESEDALTLTRLLGSRSNSVLEGNDTDYLECYKDEIRDRQAAINAAFLDGIVQSVITAAEAVGKFLDPTPNIGSAVATSIKTIHEGIKAVRNRDKDLAELLECEMVHQGLNGYWNLIVSDGNYTPVTTEGTLEFDCCETCYGETDSQVQGYCFSWCMGLEYPCTNTFITTYYQYELHDGLLSKSEQLLDGAAKVYEAKKVNHFQEQFWSQQPIKDAFVDLFNGNAGIAFRVFQ
jgi:pimeloyl-ACP methyl ester carboxylesterase